MISTQTYLLDRTGRSAPIAAAALCVFVCFAGRAQAQLEPQETVRSLSVADEFEVKLFASEPMISNPIAIDVDTQGRVWVTEGMDYRRAVKNPPVDKIKVLEDTDGDGVADKMTVFTSDLNCAMGICVAGDKIYVPESPNLYVYEDKNGDLKADGPRETLLTGFGGANHDHGVHSQVFGPDHKLYMTNGDTGFDVTGPDGSHAKFEWGAMLRCEADGSQFEAFAVNFRNPVELAVDSFGHVWCSDNDNDGLKSVRICWILEGGNYGWFGRPEEIRNPDGSFDPIHHWRADQPGFVPYVMITGFGSPCGMTFLETDAFGRDFLGKLIHCDAGPQEIRVYGPRKLPGVGYEATARNIVTSSDRYFRPIDPCVAPDGSLYVTDWYDGGVGGHAYNDPARGRIYRITPAGKQLQRREKPGPYTSDQDALVALASPNLATQFLARERLLQSGEAAISGLKDQTTGSDPILKARALWLLDRIGGAGEDIVRGHLKDDDPRFRALAVRILRRHLPQSEAAILAMADDPASEVLTEVLIAISHMKSNASTQTLMELFDKYDGRDRFLLEALHIASRGREAEVFQHVVERPNAPVDARTVNLVRALRPQDAAEYLSTRLASEKLSPEAQKSLLSALTSVADLDAGRSTSKVLLGDAPREIKQLALRALKQNLSGAWRELQTDDAVKKGIDQALADPLLAIDALEVVAQSGMPGFTHAVIEHLGGDNADRGTRLAAINVARRLGLGPAGPHLLKLVNDSEESIRQAALEALVAVRDNASLTKLLTGPGFSPQATQAAVDELARSSDGAVYLLRMIETDRLKPALAERAIAASIQHPDVNVRLLYERYVPEGERPKTLGQSFTAEQILALDGDAERGRSVFLRSGAASCTKCHRVKGNGNDIGPDLTQIGRKYGREAMLQAILDPNAGVAPEFVPYVVETASGKVYAGFIQQQDDREIHLKTIEGSVLRIPREEADEIVRQQTSLMPELLLKSVTAQDAADLLAYLADLQSVERYATEFAAVGPFPNDGPDDRKQMFGPESDAGQVNRGQKFVGLGGRKVSWTDTKTRSYAGGVPEIDLTRLTDRAKSRSHNVIYYFAVIVESTTAQPAQLNIGSDDGIQVWLNGEAVHDHQVTRALQAGQDHIEAELRQGPNLVLLKLDQGQGPAGLTFAVEARSNIEFRLP